MFQFRKPTSFNRTLLGCAVFSASMGLASQVHAQKQLEEVVVTAPFTAPFNCTGQPALSLPLGRSESGLPVGIQFVAGYGREELLLALAAAFEESMSWPAHAPNS